MHKLQSACHICNSQTRFSFLQVKDVWYGNPGTFTYRRCHTCGVWSLDPIPSSDQIASYYPDDYYAYMPAEQSPTKGTDWRQAGLEALLRSKGYPFPRFTLASRRAWRTQIAGMYYRICSEKFADIPHRAWGTRYLDFGCGARGTLPLVTHLGWQAEGLEISERAVQTGRQHGLTIHQGTATDHSLESASFDFIYSNHSFEHVPNPAETLEGLRDLLRPGGRLLIRQPNAAGLCARFGKKWGHLTAPIHIHLHTARSMALLARQTNLIVERIRTSASAFDLTDTMYLIIGKSLQTPLRHPLVSVCGTLVGWPIALLGQGCDLVTLFRRPPA